MKNDPCPCGSGKKHRQCCWLKRFDGKVTGPALLGDGAQARPHRSDPPPKVKVRFGIDYTFADGFGTGQVGYAFEQSQKFLLTTGLVISADKVEVGMRFYLDGGTVATVTATEPPKVWHPPPPGRDRNGNSLKHVVGTVKYAGHYPIMDLEINGDLLLRTTPGHRFYSADRRGWVDAGSLTAGELVQNEEGQTATVTRVSTPRFEPIELYNVEVEDFHTYFVGRPDGTSVWSHNGLTNGGCNIPKPAAPGQNPVARTGTPRPGVTVTEVSLADLHPLHPVPRPGKPPNHIPDLATKIQTNGYDLAQPIPVARMPDGRLVQFGGHHRAAAMGQLGETTIPARVVDWNSMSSGAQARWQQRFPSFPWDDFIK